MNRITADVYRNGRAGMTSKEALPTEHIPAFVIPKWFVQLVAWAAGMFMLTFVPWACWSTVQIIRIEQQLHPLRGLVTDVDELERKNSNNSTELARRAYWEQKLGSIEARVSRLENHLKN